MQGDREHHQINQCCRGDGNWGLSLQTFLHKARAHQEVFPGLVYPLYTFLLFMLLVLISFKKQIWENEVGCELGAGRCPCSVQPVPITGDVAVPRAQHVLLLRFSQLLFACSHPIGRP